MFWDDLVTLITGSQKLQWTKENKLQYLHLTMEGVSWSLGDLERMEVHFGDKFHLFFGLPNANILQ